MRTSERFWLYIVFSVLLFPLNGGFAGIAMLWLHFGYKYLEMRANLEKRRKYYEMLERNRRIDGYAHPDGQYYSDNPRCRL